MTATDSPALRRLSDHYQSMPPVATMDLRVSGYDGQCLSLHAPLARHVNDKGCAFGGSLASMMTLASWGLVWLRLEQAGLEADIFVADSQVRYRAPLFGDLDVRAGLAPESDWDDFISTLRSRGRARAGLLAKALLPAEEGVVDSGDGGDGGAAAEFSARYVAILREPTG